MYSKRAPFATVYFIFVVRCTCIVSTLFQSLPGLDWMSGELMKLDVGGERYAGY
jgi:hypothetical protein